MKWQGREQSTNVIDRRGAPGPALFGGGSIIVVIIVLAMKFLGAPPEAQRIAEQIATRAQQGSAASTGPGINDQSKEFVAVVLRDTETVWTKLFEEQVEGGRYVPPKLELFSGSVVSGCGQASAAMGPFYCPADQKVYIDPTFFDDLARRHNADGDFAQAYVIAHEVAHHVQNLTGFSDIVNEARSRGDERESNQMSVRLELQADFLAGVWAHHAHKEYGILEQGDMEEAINAANQIGDDTLQKQSTGMVIPERFTHGSSVQRARWFKRGLLSGKFVDCEELFKVQYEKL